jgi:hypothetical protein
MRLAPTAAYAADGLYEPRPVVLRGGVIWSSPSLAAVLPQPPHFSIALPGHIGRGRCSTGIEQHPHTPATLRLGRFSDGIEQLPDAPAKLRVGRFSDGIELLPDAPSTLRLGSFADGYEQVA